MGSSTSKSNAIHASTIEDTSSNLNASIVDLMKWNDRAALVQRVISGQVRDAQHDRMKGIQAIISSVEELLGHKLGAGAQENEPMGGAGSARGGSSSSSGGGPSLMGKTFSTGGSHMTGGSSAPQGGQSQAQMDSCKSAIAQLKHKITASRFMSTIVSPGIEFAASNLVRETVAFRVARQLSPSHDPEHQSKGEFSTSFEEEKKADDKEKMSMPSAEPMKSETELPPSSSMPASATSGAASASHQDAEAQSRLQEIASKFIYIHDLLEVSLRAAEHHQALHARLDMYQKMLKPKRFDTYSPMEQLRVKNGQELTKKQLEEGQLNYDRAQEAIAWLSKDWGLVLSTHTVHDHLADLKQHRQNLTDQHAATPSETSLERRIRACEPLMMQLELALAELEMARHQHERQHLSIGMLYYDSRFSGSIEAKDCMSLTAQQFALLDEDRNNVVTLSELQHAFTSQIETCRFAQIRLVQLESEMQQLQEQGANLASNSQEHERLQVLIAQHQLEIQAVQTRFALDASTLKSLYDFFHISFSVHVLGRLPSQGHVEVPRIDPKLLSNGVKDIELKGNMDPLLAQELRGVKKAQRQMLDAMTSTSHGTESTSGKAWESSERLAPATKEVASFVDPAHRETTLPPAGPMATH